MSVTELFERKFLFGLGRHLWNIVGVSGFIALLTGIILFVNSNLYETAKSKENYIGRRKLITTEKIEEATKELLPYEDWVKAEEEKGTEKLLSLKEWSQKKGIDVPDTKTEQGKALKKEYLEYQEAFIDGPASSLYDQYSEYKKPFMEEERSLYAKKDKQNAKYQDYLEDVRERNNVKRSQGLASPFVMSYGLAVIASASISSSLLSIERNTRKD